MNAQTDVVGSAERAKINKKFEQLNRKFGLGFDWEATRIAEEGELTLFLLTGPTMNDVQEYLQDKITNWAIAEKALDRGDVRKKMVNKQITVYELLIGFTDQIIEKKAEK